MGSNGAENSAIPCNDEGKCLETTVEIKIKTLDSQTYTLRVDKCVPVPALKEQIATVTGVLVEQQRLICRGKVLKDDQLLSAYHVEDGHTLHMVVRQPVAPSAENVSSHPESDPASSSGHSPGSRMGTSVLVGSFNISEQGDGIPDLGRIVSAVLNSIGIAGGGNGSEEINLNELVRERGSNTFTLGGLRNSNGQQPDQAGLRDHSIPNISSSSHSTVVPLESLQPPVIPDSLTTLSQYLTHLRQEFDTTVRGLSSFAQAVEPRGAGQDIHAASRSSGPAGLPTPASLAEVVMSTRQLLNEQTAESLSLLARQLENQVNVIDTSQRVRIQTHALRSGALLQNLGALLLELGRTMMTLRMGLTSGDAIVNAGPAIFVSTTGPNPIMVQPLPFQPGTGLGAIPVGTVQHGSGSAVGSVPSGFIPRNIDIRIRTARDRRDPLSSQHHTQIVPPISDNSTSAQQTTAESTGPSSAREPEVRVVPLRNLLSAPAPIANAAASDSSARSMGILFPVITRVHHVTSRNSNNTRASQGSENHHARNVDNGRSSMPNSTAHQENIGTPSLDAAGTSIGQEFSEQIHDGLNQLFRNFMSGEHIHSENVDSQTMGTSSVEGHTEVAQEANGLQQATPPVSEEGLLLSNMLREIMPIISESIRTTSHSSTADGENSTQGPTNSEQGQPSRRRSSRQRREPMPQQSPPKRHKRE